ncbi:hypothetical protein AB0K00_42485 [Dactylosporangium sp. NPDC049525]|uniref:hypothetical protein n=1 Tax=Dactylosporangium sp. NPDC049525 TaxID=3154730 RepID=UPI003416FD4F
MRSANDTFNAIDRRVIDLHGRSPVSSVAVRLPQACVVGLIVLAVVIGASFGRLRGTGNSSGTGAATVACIHIGSALADSPGCAGVGEPDARQPSPGATVSDEALRTILAIVDTATYCEQVTNCGQAPENHAPTSADAAAVQRALRQRGFVDAVARLASANDAAQPGALLYGVRVGDACVVGHLDAPPGGVGGWRIVGLTPQRTCLN